MGRRGEVVGIDGRYQCLCEPALPIPPNDERKGKSTFDLGGYSPRKVRGAAEIMRPWSITYMRLKVNKYQTFLSRMGTLGLHCSTSFKAMAGLGFKAAAGETAESSRIHLVSPNFTLAVKRGAAQVVLARTFDWTLPKGLS